MGIFTSKPDQLDLHHVPTPNDVFTVRQYLLTKLPAELANVILVDEAYYWPKVSHSLEGGKWIIRTCFLWDFYSSVCCLLTPRLNEWINTNGAPSCKIKAVCFKIVGHDQGWASENEFSGKYEGSWTWFEAAIVRNMSVGILQGSLKADDQIWMGLEAQGENVDFPLTVVKNPHSDSGRKGNRWHVQSNIRAHSEAVRHTILWTDKIIDDIDEQALYTETGSKSGRGFIRSLEMGDRIAVIARAKYPGWQNHIGKIDLEVYYSV